MNELVGFLLLAVASMLVLMILVEIYDAVVAGIRRRRRRHAGGLGWLDDDSTPTEPGFHLGASSFHLDGSESLLRRRHRRRLELEPRGRWGFAAKWIQDP